MLYLNFSKDISNLKYKIYFGRCGCRELKTHIKKLNNTLLKLELIELYPYSGHCGWESIDLNQIDLLSVIIEFKNGDCPEICECIYIDINTIHTNLISGKSF